MRPGIPPEFLEEPAIIALVALLTNIVLILGSIPLRASIFST